MYAWPIALTLFVLLLVKVVNDWLRMYSMTRDGMPSILPMPVLGVNLFKLWAHLKELHVPVLKDTLTYGVIHRAWYYQHPMIVVHDPDELANLLGKSVDIFDRSRHEMEGFKELLGDGMLLVPNGNRWKKAREILAPMFHRRSLKAMHKQMVQNGKDLLKRIGTLDGKRVDIQAEFQKLTFDTIARITIGIDLHTQTEANESEFGRAWRVIFDFLHFRFFCPIPYWIQDRLPMPGRTAYRRELALLQCTVDQAIEARRNLMASRSSDEGKSQNEEPDDFLGYLLAEQLKGADLSIEYIRNELVTLLFAGHDTTTNLLTWAIFYLCTDPARLRILQCELDEQLQGQAPTFDQLAQLRYLRFVIKETLRLQPSAPLRGRTLTQDTKVGKWLVKAGTDFLYSPWALHRLPSLWRDPVKFCPERFDPDSELSQTLGNNHPFAYLPFGGGPRRCIGEPLAMQEAAIVLATLLQHFEPHLAPDQIIRPVVELTLRAEHGLVIQFSLRRR